MSNFVRWTTYPNTPPPLTNKNGVVHHKEYLIVRNYCFMGENIHISTKDSIIQYMQDDMEYKDQE